MVGSLGDAYDAGWKAVAKCEGWSRIGGAYHSACGTRYELDMQTLVWTRGRALALECLHKRLKCPKCGDRKVKVLFEPPNVPNQNRARGSPRRDDD
jgi:hypothetical protein